MERGCGFNAVSYFNRVHKRKFEEALRDCWTLNGVNESGKSTGFQ